MSDPVIGLLGFLVALVLAFVGVPVGLAMAMVGVAGFTILNGPMAAGFALSVAPFEAVFPYSLSVVPLFVAMGVFAARSGVSRGLFDMANAVVGRLRGGVAIATIGACALFGAICGSSLATAATMGRIAVPEMRRVGYADSISAGTVAAAGTLGVLIPPSVLLVIYALLTETSIGQLFIAALIPGLLAVALYVLAVVITIRIRPNLVRDAPPGPAVDWYKLGLDVMPALLLFAVVIGGLYLGLFSPTEAAAIGATGAFLLALAKRISASDLLSAALETVRTSAMIFFILIGAALFNFFLESTGLSGLMSGWIGQSDLSPISVMLIILLFYVVLGCFMDALSMILLTIPVVFPLVTGLGFDPIWFGIIVVSVAEIGLITPPIGINLFIIQGVVSRLRQADVMRGVIPFIVADIVRILLLVAFPGLVLLLPSMM
ncbi:TRAP transporter large permease [Fodinicurvata sp. EGI_FJ10296]|uniref:TRAP transporter large permease n=1 Tax=Fodinicurvata sp. EGI_FJ10296 TaxID=3231908 RepID=UPI003455FD34